jgi:hypothetical protein
VGPGRARIAGAGVRGQTQGQGAQSTGRLGGRPAGGLAGTSRVLGRAGSICPLIARIPPGSGPRGFSFRLLAARVSAPVPSQHGLASQDKSRVSWVASEFILSQIARLHPARSPRGSSLCGFVSRRRSTPSPSPSLRSPTAIISVAPRVFLVSRCGSHLRTRPLGIHIVRAACGGASHVASHNK